MVYYKNPPSTIYGLIELLQICFVLEIALSRNFPGIIHMESQFQEKKIIHMKYVFLRPIMQAETS